MHTHTRAHTHTHTHIYIYIYIYIFIHSFIHSQSFNPFYASLFNEIPGKKAMKYLRRYKDKLAPYTFWYSRALEI